LCAECAQHIAEEENELVAIHALGILSQTRARQQFIDRWDVPQLLGLLGGDGGFRHGEPEGAMFARFSGIHGNISAQASRLPQWKPGCGCGTQFARKLAGFIDRKVAYF